MTSTNGLSDSGGLSPEKRKLLALLLEAEGVQDNTTIPLRDKSQHARLSYAQQRLWFLNQLEPNSAVYNIARGLHINSAFNVTALERTLTEIIRRHEILRTTFPMIDGEPRQVVAPMERITLQLMRDDLRKLSEMEREQALQSIYQEEINHLFDLAEGHLFRTRLVQVGDEEHVLLVTVHHIISDGWSLGLLVNELGTLYKAFLAGEESPLAELEIQYADYAEWQREHLQGERLERQLTYWRKQLAGAPATTEFPTDRLRPPAQSFRGTYRRVQLSRRLSEELKSLSEKLGATLFMTTLAAFQVLLARYTNQFDLVVGSPIAGRTRREIEPLIGLFLNTLVLRTDLSGDPTFSELVKRVRETTLGAYTHQDVPFERLVEELKPERDLSRTPLFQTMFILQNMPMGLPGFSLNPVGTEATLARYDLTVELAEAANGIVLVFEYNTDLFDETTIARMMRHYEHLLEAVCADAGQRVSALPLMTEEEQQQLLVGWNQTAHDYPRHNRVHQLFEQQAARTPQAIAAVCGAERISFAELNDRAEQFARYLRRLGVGREAPVGVMVERSIEMIVALLGTLKAGGAYLPLDHAFPVERIEFMLEDAGARVLVSQRQVIEKMPASFVKQLAKRQTIIVCLEEEARHVSHKSTEDVEGEAGSIADSERATADDLAYVIYTSGSTGVPKGVCVTHRALTNFLCAMRCEPGLCAADVLVAVTTLSFDIAGLELYLPLITGARVVIARREEVMDGGRLGRVLVESGATVMQATPATWRMMIEAGWAGDKGLKALCGGEALPRELAEQLGERAGEVWNMYGPTETTIWSSVCKVESWSEEGAGKSQRVGTKRAGANVSLGRPIANTQFYVLDEHLNPVPIGVAGELYIGGDGVARGYLRRPELTAERFIPDPFSAVEGGQLYRTGDSVRWDAEGRVEYLGRLDTQVKVRGYRIEVGEIEAVLSEHGAVRQAVVTVREDVAGDKRLVAYIIAAPDVAGNGHSRRRRNGDGGSNGDGVATATSEWREHLRGRLPEYMVPSLFVVLDELPLTPNGKVDRNRLPAPNELRPGLANDEQAFVSAKDNLELQLTKIWEKVLGVSPIGISDNFFDLGGHSLLAVRLFTQIEKTFNRHLPLALLFKAPTIERLAEALRGEGWQSTWSSLVPLKPAGSLPPFFCVHSLGANLVSYYLLASRMDTDQPFYGLQPQGLDGKQASHTRIEEMASHYLQEIRAVQPEGPYHLGGVCLGGTVAFEMAQQLHREGEQVASLVLIDSYRPGEIEHMPKHMANGRAQLADYHLGTLLMLKRRERLNYALVKARNLTLRTRREFQRRAYRKPEENGSFLEENLRRVYEANSQAERQYEPQIYQGRITLFWSSEAAIRCYRDRRLHWSDLATEGFEVHSIPGDHMTMIEEPYVRVLAAKLQASLKRASSRSPLVRTSAVLPTAIQ